MNDQVTKRAKILGELIGNARVRSGRSIDECARTLGISDEEYIAVEEGDRDLSLPDLEVLAIFLNVPMSYFWGRSVPDEERQVDFASYVALRHRIIGALVRQARLEVDLPVDVLAERTGLDLSQIEAYESGEQPIPYFELENIAGALEVPTSYFAENKHGPLAKHEDQHQIRQNFDELPPQMKAFVAKPTNISYLETAMRLSEMDVDRLRSIAESILDITF